MNSRLAIGLHGGRLEGRYAISRVELWQGSQQAARLIEAHRAIGRSRQWRWHFWERIASMTADDILNQLHSTAVTGWHRAWYQACSPRICTSICRSVDPWILRLLLVVHDNSGAYVRKVLVQVHLISNAIRVSRWK